MSSQEEKTWGMFSHLIPLLTTVVTSLGWVAALALYLAYKDKSKFVAFHALQELYFTIALWLLFLVGFVLFFTVIGIPVAILIWAVVGIAWIAGPIVAAVKANSGEWWEYPIVGKIARQSVGA